MSIIMCFYKMAYNDFLGVLYLILSVLSDAG